MYKCLDCGHLFEEGEEKIKKEYMGCFLGGSYVEESSVCPHCGGDFEETEECKCCGKPFRAEELYSGYCEDCAEKKITYQNALEFFQEEDSVCDFIFVEVFKLPKCEVKTDELRSAMKELFLRYVADDRIRNVENFLDLIKAYIFRSSSTVSRFMEFVG